MFAAHTFGSSYFGQGPPGVVEAPIVQAAVLSLLASFDDTLAFTTVADDVVMCNASFFDTIMFTAVVEDALDLNASFEPTKRLSGSVE